MSEHVGKQLGDFIGQFLQYDTNNNAGFWKSYMRISVAIDVSKPLKRCKKIRKSGGEWFIVNFKYEKFGSFCFVCGRLGHTERFCESLFSAPEEEVKRGWGVWLRAPDRRHANTEGSRWLREDGTDGSNGGTGKLNSGPTGSERAEVGENLKIIQNPIFLGKMVTGLGALNDKQILHDFRRLIGDSLITKKFPINKESIAEDVGLNLIEDRKRRRAAQSHEAH